MENTGSHLRLKVPGRICFAAELEVSQYDGILILRSWISRQFFSACMSYVHFVVPTVAYASSQSGQCLVIVGIVIVSAAAFALAVILDPGYYPKVTA